MSTPLLRLWSILLVLGVSVGGAPRPLRAADEADGTRPIHLQLVSPHGAHLGARRNIQYRAGWPLALRLTIRARDMLGIAVDGPNISQLFPFPEPGLGGFIVLNDPDGCCSLCFGTEPCAPGTAWDETFVEFHPERGDLTGFPDASGNLFVAVALADHRGRPPLGGPTLLNDPSGPELVGVDGVGYGPDDDLPGLVLLSDIGVGVVRDPLDEGWGRVVPAAAHNLAGMFSTVSYELNDQRRRTTITASMIVPRHLFTRLRLVDDCVGEVDIGAHRCLGESLQRFADGPEEPLDLHPSANDESEAVLRAFVVRPQVDLAVPHPPPPGVTPFEYPATLTDMDGDGIVGAADARLMGFEVLSNEVVFRIRQVGNAVLSSAGGTLHVCSSVGGPGLAVPTRGTDVFVDLDGNGYAEALAHVCPLASGGVIQPPRS